MSFATEEKVWYKRNKEVEPEKAKFIQEIGQNTAVLEKKGQPILADQFRTRFEPEDVEIPEEEHEKTEEEENETELNMEESANDVINVEEYEDRSRSPLKRTEQMWKWHRPFRVVRSY